MPQKISALPVKAKVRDTKTKYYGVPIGWVIGDKNHSGYPSNSTTLVAESIIKICCFDATESGGNSDRQNYGNNRYSLANIRQWLNIHTHCLPVTKTTETALVPLRKIN